MGSTKRRLQKLEDTRTPAEQKLAREIERKAQETRDLFDARWQRCAEQRPDLAERYEKAEAALWAYMERTGESLDEIDERELDYPCRYVGDRESVDFYDYIEDEGVKLIRQWTDAWDAVLAVSR